jgi:indole-3-glycerol phosphate synthase
MILQEIAAKTRQRVAEQKACVPLAQLKMQAENMDCSRFGCFRQALLQPGMSFICEVKKASPSKGVIAADFPYQDIARQYDAAGASAISILTEPHYFQGSDDYLRQIRQLTDLPLLRKDFTVDDYMIYEAKTLGADAVLLICALLDSATLQQYLQLCQQLGLEALVEAHDEAEVQMALQAGARIIGVNNRNLKDFTVDIGNSIRLRKLVPENVVFVAESGMKTRADIAQLEAAQVNGVLIGETLMRSDDKKQMLQQLKGLS